MGNKSIKVLLALLALMFTRVGLLTAYADEHTDSGRHFELINNTWYALNNKQEFIYGWTYDSYGNLYETKEDGSLYMGVYHDGKYFNSDGVYMPTGIWSKEQYVDACKALENNGYITLENKDELIKFIEYYIYQYRFWDNTDIGIPFKKTASGIRVWLTEELRYSKETFDRALLNRLGSPVGNTATEKMIDACRRVAGILEYDAEYLKRNAIDCLRDSKAVCWFYAKAVSLMLNSVGVEAENMVVDNFGTVHMIVRARDGEHWIYCDPTACDTINLDRYSNLSYEDVVFHYKPLNDVHID